VKRNAPNLGIGNDHGQGIRKGAGLGGSVGLTLKIEKDLVHGRGNVPGLETVKDLNLETGEGLNLETEEGRSLEISRGQNQRARLSRGGPSLLALIKRRDKEDIPKVARNYDEEERGFEAEKIPRISEERSVSPEAENKDSPDNMDISNSP